MYLSEDRIEKNVLRQGDIIANTQILGAINLNGINFLTDAKGEKMSWGVSKPPEFSPAIVLSHSCEIDRENSIKLTSIILAPLRDISKATSADKVQDLIDSNIISEETTHSYLKYFYLPKNTKLPFSHGCVADFSKCYSVRKQSYDLLLENKVLQLEDSTVGSFSLKLSLYFYRYSQSA